MGNLQHAFTQIEQGGPDPDADFSLPGWIYHDPEFFALEMERVFRPSWQIVCHVSELPNPGDWRTLDYLGESVIVIRGHDGVVRAFTNVCRHRAMRLVEGTAGCAKKLICPYHAWTYETDGRLTGVPMKGEYPSLKLEESGLAPVALEIWHGFVFVRLADGGSPAVSEMMAPFEAEVAPYRLGDMQPMGEAKLRPRGVNWKNVGDNYSDNLHIPVAHDGLPRLAHLPPEAHGRWLYYKLWPNMAFDIYADQIDFMQWLPLTPTTCLIREMAYCLPDADTPPGQERTMKLVRYANWRINRRVNAEDTWLITRVQEGMASRSYGTGPIARSEVCLRSFARKIRALVPEARQPFAPAPGWSRQG